MTPPAGFSTWDAIGPAGNHLWQSTLFAAIAGLLALTLRNNRAQVRYWLWLAASVKFLIPFDVLVTIGRQLARQSSPAIVQPDVTLVVDAMSQPFSYPELFIPAAASTAASSPAVADAFPLLLLAIWLCGVAVVLLAWCVRWRRVAVAVRDATPVRHGRELDALRRLERIGGIRRSIGLVSSNAALEPGVFGIVRPVLVWPRAVAERLGDEQLEAILAHELCHVRRRDNLAAAVHTLVEAVFWFHPLVWWLGARLLDERERACDEEVIRSGSDPQVYAESILRTCEVYVASRPVCVAGVSGADLKRRIERIMRNTSGEKLNSWRKLLLVAATVVAIAGPIVVGALKAPALRAAESPAAAAGEPEASELTSAPAPGVASVKPNTSGDRRATVTIERDGRFTATNITLRGLIRSAYGTGTSLRSSAQILGGPGWIDSDRFDITASAVISNRQSFPEEQIQLMLRTLLADRFKLTVHDEKRELPVYALVIARSDGRPGPLLRRSEVACAAAGGGHARRDHDEPGMFAAARLLLGTPLTPPTCGTHWSGPGRVAAKGVTMAQLAATLSVSPRVDRAILDRTGLTGSFDLNLRFTPQSLPSPFASLVEQLGLTSSIFTAVQEQLGLKLDPQTGPVDVLVIDHAERPSED